MWLLNANISAGNAARQWLLIAVSHVVLCCVKRSVSKSSNASTSLKNLSLVWDWTLLRFMYDHLEKAYENAFLKPGVQLVNLRVAGVGKHFLRRATLKRLLLPGAAFVYFSYNLRFKIWINDNIILTLYCFIWHWHCSTHTRNKISKILI